MPKKVFRKPEEKKADPKLAVAAQKRLQQKIPVKSGKATFNNPLLKKDNPLAGITKGASAQK
jgi:hypothetical protein